MTEEVKILDELPMVEFEDAVDFFQQRTGKPCPACGHTKWDVSAAFGDGPKAGWALTAVNLSTSATVQVGTPVAYAECRKCAYLRIHDMRAIAKWIEKGKPEFNPDE